MPSLRSRGGCSQWCKELTLLAVFVWLACPIGYGQTGQGTISGTVADQSGASVATARVTAKNTGTGLERTTTTSESGSYALPNLPVGTYDLSAVGDQFKTQTLSGVTLTTDQAATVNFTLQVGSVTESVTVAGNQDLIETASPTLNQVVGERAIQELPLNGREPAALVTAPAQSAAPKAMPSYLRTAVAHGPCLPAPRSTAGAWGRRRTCSTAASTWTVIPMPRLRFRMPMPHRNFEWRQTTTTFATGTPLRAS